MNLALFDLDYTLLNGDSDHSWGQFLAQEGVVDATEHRRRNDEFFGHYKAGTLDINAYLKFALSAIAGKTPDELTPLHAKYMRDVIAPMITTQAKALVAQHANDLCAVVTATNAFVTAPIAKAFKIDTLIACDVEIVEGRYTGASIGVPSFREGKITRVEMWLASIGKTFADFERSYFYSDSHNDLPLMEKVTNPVAVSPDKTLEAHAIQRRWPIISLK